VKTAISLPDELFEEAEQVASRLSLSRSQLYARAIAEFVRKWNATEIRESYDRAYGEAGSVDESALLREAAYRTLKASDW
jgi:predicted transcriptional regulator